MAKKTSSRKNKNENLGKAYLKTKPKHSPAAVTRPNQDGTVSVLDLQNDEAFFSIDGLAAEVWTQLDGKKTLETILMKISKKENVELPILEKECLMFFSQLKSQNLLAEVDTGK